MAPELVNVELRRELRSPREARRAVRRFAKVLGDRTYDVELLTSELIANAVKYGGQGDVQLHMGISGNRVRVEVVDQGSGFQAKRRADDRDRTDLDTVGGWGLPIVEHLAADWGSFEGSTHVWFEIELQG
jgi:anti-sigma regulatory factor (Ser/Thr protein kinase)